MKRRIFKTGSQRDSREGKGRMDLLPAHAILRVSQHFETGAKRYEDRNWEKGQPLSIYMDSGMRHLFKYLGNEQDEPDHLVAAAWNILCLIETEYRIKKGLLPRSLKDLPNPNL